MGADLGGILVRFVEVLGALSLFDALVVAVLAYRRGGLRWGSATPRPEPKVLREAREVVNFLHA